MRVYAVVGGIGAGKSTIARRLARAHGGAWVDVDRFGHQALRHAAVRQRLLAAFGPDIVGRDGAIDRRRLGRAVFGKPQRLRQLNAIVHPEMVRRVRVRLRDLERRGTPVAILDAALFFDLDLGAEVDGVLAVVAPRAVRRARLLQRGSLAATEIDARLRSQPGLASWTRRADVRLQNDCPPHELGTRLDEAWRQLGTTRRRPAHGRN